MEARLEAVPSQTWPWWTKVGKWQALMAVLALGVFFVTLSITGDTKTAAVAVILGAGAALAVGAYSLSAAALAAGAAVLAAVLASAKHPAATVLVAAIFVALAVVVAGEVPGVSKKAIRLSYTGEFLLIFLPMLLVLRG